MAGSIRELTAEFLGAFAWVLFVCGAVVARAQIPGSGHVCLALAQGLAVAAVFGLLGRYSIGYFNPALTAGLLLLKRLTPVKAVLCLVCQLFGAVLAALLLHHIYSFSPETVSAPLELGTPVLSGPGFRSATLMEAVLTFFLALAVFRSSADSRTSSFRTRAIFVGAVAACAMLAAGPITGAALNPARAFGPALVSGHWTHHYVYWFGPLAGALAGAGVAQVLFRR